MQVQPSGVGERANASDPVHMRVVVQAPPAGAGGPPIVYRPGRKGIDIAPVQRRARSGIWHETYAVAAGGREKFC